MLTAERLQSILSTLPRLTIGLVGDLFLDRYLDIAPGSSEVSLETGLEAYQVERVRNAPGALGTVMNNLAALGVGLLVPVSVIGDDGHGFDLVREVRRLPADLANLLCVSDRLTPTYTKPMRLEPADSRQPRELNRLDLRTRTPLSSETTAEVCRRVEDVFNTSDGLIVLDQIIDEDCGVINASVRQTLERLARAKPGRLMFVDSRRFLSRFTAATLKGNRAEVLAARDQKNLLHTADEDAAVQNALAALSRTTSRPAFCTIGEGGILVALPGQQPTLVPGYASTRPTDIVGAGDAATSGIVTALLAGANELEAAALGNLVASITGEQLGVTGTATPQPILARWRANR